uniref:Uncharacterized protein n=1 Tax=Arundo donax TaxID=35708 RepID=A0A0A8YZ61_ARUDO
MAASLSCQFLISISFHLCSKIC